MNEENKGASKNKWSRIFRKKWFFPAVYLTIAALLLSAVVWYQNVDNQIPDAMDDQEQEETSDDFSPTPVEEDAEPVADQQENIEMPVANQDQAEIVTKFYDYSAEQEDQENALVLYNNRFYQSTGVDITSADGETFDVQAALSGTVTEVKEDPLLGNVVSLSHENEVMTYYASLDEVGVTAGDEVSQGDQLGTAGQNLFGQDNGNHVHFQLRKNGNEVDPESYFNQPVSSLDGVTDEEAEEDSKVSEESEATEDADVPDGIEEPDATEETEDGTVDEDADSGMEEEEDADSELEDEDTTDNEEETNDSSEDA
ncbi:peptidoglycan DD-metalloendopeptidase family protein [Virgibacillus ainsalahensis]